MYDEVYAGCGAGRVRNPRTARCVKKRRALGAAIHAAAQQLAQGDGRVPPCGPKTAWDFATRGCVADAARVRALRALYDRWALADAANASTRNRANRDARAARAADLQARAADLQARAEARAAELEARAADLEARVLGYDQRLANGDQRLARCQADLTRARQKVRMIEAALLENGR